MKAAALLIVLGTTTAHADGGTVAKQAGLGFAGGTGGGIVGAIAGGLIGHAIENRGSGPTWLGAKVGGSLGIAAGVAWGVERGGDDEGTLTGTLIGTAGGAASIVLFELIVKAADKKLSDLIRIPVYATCMLTGAILGYHASADSPPAMPIIGGVF